MESDAESLEDVLKERKTFRAEVAGLIALEVREPN